LTAAMIEQAMGSLRAGGGTSATNGIVARLR